MARASAEAAPGWPPLQRLQAFSDLLAERVGLNFPPDRWADLELALTQAAPELGCADAAECVRLLLASPLSATQVEILASHLTIGETYFFRDPAVFAVLQNRILPELIAERRRRGERHLRLWSAGCSTGEEAYSLAMAVDRLLPEAEDWNITILATDINPHVLAKAARGAYREWSFRSAAPTLKTSCCTRTAEGLYLLAPRLRAMVTFAHLNLAEDAYPDVVTNTNGMDIVFCRNVLMYFRKDRAQAAIERLARCLVDGGWLVVSPVELSLVAAPDLVPQRLPDVTLFRKGAPAPAAQPVRPPSAEAVRPPPPRTGPRSPSRPSRRRAAPPPAESPVAPAARLYADGAYADAAAAARSLLLQQPDNAEAMALLARALANQGHLTEAAAWCDRAVAADKLNPVWTYLQASVLIEQGQLEAATAALRRTLYLQPGAPLAHFTLGSLLLRHGRAGEASRHFRNALSALHGVPPEQVLREAEGMTAGRLTAVVESALMEAPDAAA